MKKVLSILLAVLVIGACATTDANAKTRRSSGGAKVKATPEAVKNAYIKQLEHLKKNAKESTGRYQYFFFDISGDNVPEMFVQVGTCDMDYEMHLYTYSGGKAKRITSGANGLNPFDGYMEKDGIIIFPVYFGGIWKAQKVTLSNNRIKITTIKQGTVSRRHEDEDYFKTYEYVDWYPIDYFEPLQNIQF